MRVLELVWKTLQCPICLDVALPPVWQCTKGHHVCKNCRPKVVVCGLCRERFTEARNYIAEYLVDDLPLPCKYRTDGCFMTSSISDKEKHEEECDYRQYLCSGEDCNVSFNSQQVLHHFRRSHPNSDILQGTKHETKEAYLFEFSVTGDTTKLLLIPEWGSFIFTSTATIQGEYKRCFIVQAVLSETKARNFRSKIALSDRESRVFKYSAQMQSLTVPRDTIISTRDCLIVYRGLLTSFNPHKITINISK